MNRNIQLRINNKAAERRGGRLSRGAYNVRKPAACFLTNKLTVMAATVDRAINTRRAFASACAPPAVISLIDRTTIHTIESSLDDLISASYLRRGGSYNVRSTRSSARKHLPRLLVFTRPLGKATTRNIRRFRVAGSNN